jgi:curved DNA-binding protein CbpA
MSHYDELGVAPNATQSEIETAFHRLTQAYYSGENPDRARAAQSAKAVAEAYRVLRDPDTRKEYDAGLEWMQSPVKDGAISEQEFRSWLEAGKVSEGITAKIEAERLRREKEEREKEEKELAKERSSDDALYAAWAILRLSVIAVIGIGAVWLLITIVRYFWTHPLF